MTDGQAEPWGCKNIAQQLSKLRVEQVYNQVNVFYHFLWFDFQTPLKSVV